MKKITIISICYFLIIVALFLYSYTQVDLSLTLSRASLFQTIEKSFQYIGYFNRPLSSALYIILLLFLYSFYILFMFLAHKKIITIKQIWVIIGITTILLTFSYNAFSYDLFNYIFDAKIITYYHLNPYFQKALDFPHDPMLSFMHWTQRTYPYGPVWLFLTVPISFIGFQYFLITFFLFKILIAVSYLGSVFLLSKILQKIKAAETIFGMILFALNPLVLIEALVSAHNDVTMMFFTLLAIWLMIRKKQFIGYISLLVSIGIKFATIFILPVFLYVSYQQKRNKNIDWHLIVIFNTLLMFFAVYFASVRTNFQPWYLLYILPLAVLIGKKFYTIIPIGIITFFSLLQYLPFIYSGNWNPPIPSILNGLLMAGILLTIVLMLLYYIYIKNISKNKRVLV